MEAIKRAIAILIMMFAVSICYANINVKTYYEQVNEGFEVYVDNKEHCPVSIRLDFELENLNASCGISSIHVIEPNIEKQLLAKLSVINQGKASKFSYKTLTQYGNDLLEDYDKDYIYDLPFMYQATYIVSQGYNGKTSHKDENCIDFNLPIGTKIAAMREGVVVKVVDENYRSCPEEECNKYNNQILIYHPDGTFAEYVHIRQHGSEVKVGEKVTKGQVIGYSGNVGWSSGPHLHIAVFLNKLYKRKTLETKFRINDGNNTEYLVEKKSYTRNY